MIKKIKVTDCNCSAAVVLGRKGEFGVTEIDFDCSEYKEMYGSGSAQIVHSMNGAVYIVTTTSSGNIVKWPVSASDTSAEGSGIAELRWYVDGGLKKSVKIKTIVLGALEGTTGDAPDAVDDWITKATALYDELSELDITENDIRDIIESYGYLTEHQSLSEYQKTTAADSKYAAKKIVSDYDASSSDTLIAYEDEIIEIEIPTKLEMSQKVGYVERVGTSLNLYSDSTKEKLIGTVTLPSGGSGSDWTEAQIRALITGYGYITSSALTGYAKTTDIPTIPTSLKNPYALTINGTVYDGSEAKEVTVSGGSSEWILDQTITLTEDVTQILCDLNKSTKELLIVSKSTMTSSGSKFFYPNKSSHYLSVASAITNQFLRFYVCVTDRIWYSETVTNVFNGFTNAYGSTRTNELNINELSSFKLTISASSGTVFYVYRK